MKSWYLFIAVFILFSCKPKPAKVIKNPTAKLVRVMPSTYKIGSIIKAYATDTAGNNNQLDAYANYYVLVADTGKDYGVLRVKMFTLHESSNLVIDTMGRYYDKAKDLIELADNDQDDMYAGEYYPRRFPSQTLSMEYLDEYRLASKSKMIALIAGIYETKASADSASNTIRAGENAFVQKARIYVGCMH